MRESNLADFSETLAKIRQSTESTCLHGRVNGTTRPLPTSPTSAPTLAPEPTVVAQALHLAGEGFDVLPVTAARKFPPLITDFPNRATRDPATITAWWTQWPGANTAISTTRFGDNGEGLLVVDVDCKDGKRGNESLLRLELEGKKFPHTREQRTPSGGQHLIYRVATPVRQSVEKLAPGLDIRSAGGYILAAGSRTENGVYTMDATPIVHAPQWLIEKCGAARDRSAEAATILPGIDPEQAHDRAVHYLKTDAPLAVQGQGGDECAYKVAARCKDLGIDKAECFHLMAEHWNQRCSPPWDEVDLNEKILHAYKYGLDPIGSAAPEAVFAPIPEAGQPTSSLDPRAPWLEAMNEENFVVNQGREVLVYRLAFDPVLRRRKFDRHPFSSLQQLFQNDLVPVVQESGKVMRENKAIAWLKHPLRRQYLKGAAYAPGHSLPAGMFNLDTGFGIEPKPGPWPLMQAHLRNVICSRDEAAYRYVMGWLAHAVQHRGDRALVALVLRGDRGVGKGILGNTMLRIFGQHSVYVSNAEQLIGKFNGHLEDCSFLFGDECLFPGDKRHLSTLKALITESSIPVEEKFEKLRQVKNCLHIFLASNEQFVVPAGRDERRFCVLDVANTHKQSRRYFDPLRHELGLDDDTDRHAHGAAAMLHDLLEYDLADFDITSVPKTGALLEQKLDGMNATQKWLYECLHHGAIPGAWGKADPWETHDLALDKQAVYATYRQYSKQSKEYRAAESGPWMKELNTILYACVRDSRPWVKDGERPRVLTFVKLGDCRKSFERWIGQPIEWQTDGEITNEAQTKVTTEYKKIFGE